MKKIAFFLLVALMLPSLIACGTKVDEPTGQIADLFNKGYMVSFTRSGDNEIGVMLEDADNLSHIAITANVTSKQIKKFDSIDIMDVDYENEIKLFLCELDSTEIEELDSLVPTDEELATFNGRKISDIEAEGFDQWGYTWGEGEYNLVYDNGIIIMNFTIKDANGIENVDEASPEEIGALEISSASFYDISDCYFDN